MATSLVERLNDMSNRFGSGRSHDPMAASASDLMDEAANEIEDLRERLASLQSQLAEYQRWENRLKAEAHDQEAWNAN